MTVYYCKMQTGNVGDDLNATMWKDYIDFDKMNENDVIIGIGSILNDKIPVHFTTKNVYVVGSGVGYGKLPNITDKWCFVGVRGIISRRKLALPDDIPLLDAAYLADFSHLTTTQQKKKFGYIPHLQSLDNGDWQNVCDAAELELLDPRIPVDDFIKKLKSCDKVLCEAMHGAIFADMCRIPWQPVKAYTHIDETKWDDWLSAFDSNVKFQRVNGIWRHIEVPKNERFKNFVKTQVLKIYESSNIYKPIFPESSEKDFDKLVNQLERLKNEEFFLNSDSTIQIAKSRLIDSIKQYDWAKS